MKTSHSIVFFVIILVVIAAAFFIFKQRTADQPKVLLQTLDCQSDKIDQSVYNLAGNTSLIGAFISFNEVPLSEESTQQITDLGVKLKTETQIFDYMLTEIPTESLCTLVEHPAINRIFIPEVNLEDQGGALASI